LSHSASKGPSISWDTWLWVIRRLEVYTLSVHFCISLRCGVWPPNGRSSYWVIRCHRGCILQLLLWECKHIEDQRGQEAWDQMAILGDRAETRSKLSWPLTWTSHGHHVASGGVNIVVLN
jgi:hypothetical protein